MVFFDKIDDVIYDNGLKIKILAPCKVWYSGQQQWQKINRWKSMGEHEKHTETTTDCEKRSMSPYRFRTSRNKIAQKQIEKCQDIISLTKTRTDPPPCPGTDPLRLVFVQRKTSYHFLGKCHATVFTRCSFFVCTLKICIIYIINSFTVQESL